MGTKQVTLVPDAYSFFDRPVSVNDWRTYDGSEIRSDTGYLWFRFPASLIQSINGTLNVSGAIVSGYDDILEYIDYYYSPNSAGDSKSKIGTLSVYPFSGSKTDNISTGERYLELDRFYIRASSSQVMYGAITSFRGTVTYTDLTIEDITPSTANVGDEVTVKFGNWLGETITLTLTANNKTIATFTVSNSDYGSDGTYTFTCGTDWFTKAGATGNEFDITVTAVEDGALQRTATSSFKLKREGIGTEVTHPTVTGADKRLTLNFTKRNGHDLTVKIEGAAKGEQNRVTLVTETIVTEDSYSTIAADTWFRNIAAGEMTVYITVTDTVDQRQDTPSFTLGAGPNLYPYINSVELSNISGNELLDNKGYVAGYSRIAIKVNGGTRDGHISSLKANAGFENNISGFTWNSTTQRFESETSATIPSSSRVTVTVTIKDGRGLEASKSAYIESSSITTLPKITLRQTEAIYAGPDNDKVSYVLSPEGWVGSYHLTITDISDKYTIVPRGQHTKETVLLIGYSNYFTNTGNQGQASMKMRVYIEDGLGRKIDGGYVTFTIFAPKPIVNSFTCTHIPNGKMPDSGTPSKSDIVAGYSKFKFAANVQWFCTPDSVKVTSSANDTYTLTKTGNFSPNNESWPRTANYEFTMTDTIKPNYATIKYTPTAKDSGTATGSYSRNGETKATREEKTFTIYNLKNLTISPSQQNVNAGDNAAFTVSNFVASYDYEFKAANVTKALASGKSKKTAQFTQECQASWFTTAKETGTTLSVTVTITDALGRTATGNVSVKLLQLVIQSVTGSPFILGSSTPITVKVEGASGRTVTLSFTTPSGLSKSATIAAGSTSKDITPDLTWFANDAKKSSITVTVTADNGSQYNPTKTFDVQFPDLTLTVDRTSVYVGASFVTLDNTIKYTVGNRYGETITLGFEYQQKAINKTYTFSADSYSLATPQFFDIIGSSVDALQKISVVPVAKDARGRVARAGSIEIKADSSLGLIFDRYAFEPINPNGIDPQFANRIISDISRMRIKFRLTRNSLSPIDKVYAIHAVRAQDGTYYPESHLMSSIGDGWYQYETDDPIHIDGETSPSEPGAIIFDISWNCEANDKRGLGIFARPRTISTALMYYHVPITTISYRRCIKEGNSYLPDDSGEYCQVTCQYDFEGFWTQITKYYKAVTTLSYQRCRLEGDTYIPDSAGEYYEIESSFEGEPVVFHTPIEEISIQRCSLSGDTYVPDESGKYYEIICDQIPYYMLEHAVEKTAVTAKNQGTINVQSTGYNQSFSPNFDQLQTTKGTHVFIIPNRSMEHSYDITVTVSDLITSVPYTFYLSTAGVIMDFTNTSTGAGIGLGKVAEHGKMVEVSPEWTFQAANINVQVNGSMVDLGTLLQQIKTKIGL